MRKLRLILNAMTGAPGADMIESSYSDLIADMSRYGMLSVMERYGIRNGVQAETDGSFI